MKFKFDKILVFANFYKILYLNFVKLIKTFKMQLKIFKLIKHKQSNHL